MTFGSVSPSCDPWSSPSADTSGIVFDSCRVFKFHCCHCHPSTPGWGRVFELASSDDDNRCFVLSPAEMAKKQTLKVQTPNSLCEHFGDISLESDSKPIRQMENCIIKFVLAAVAQWQSLRLRCIRPMFETSALDTFGLAINPCRLQSTTLMA